MPQMAPMNWLFLFMFFFFIFMLFNIFNYFMFLPPKTSKSNFKMNKLHSLNWKW